ncbi:hypothetical protein X946_3767 [Burkholderia sp. ABCPW 111]|nr:hypothetical protein X946_3767 [Burkholderia sp. ABCPW 111]
MRSLAGDGGRRRGVFRLRWREAAAGCRIACGDSRAGSKAREGPASQAEVRFGDRISVWRGSGFVTNAGCRLFRATRKLQHTQPGASIDAGDVVATCARERCAKWLAE